MRTRHEFHELARMLKELSLLQISYVELKGMEMQKEVQSPKSVALCEGCKVTDGVCPVRTAHTDPDIWYWVRVGIGSRGLGNGYFAKGRFQGCGWELGV